MQLFLYNIGIQLYFLIVRLLSVLGNKKAKKFTNGRKGLFLKAQQALANKEGDRVWFHFSSLGEFEQGRPLIEQLKLNNPQKVIIITFFSPSGYESKKNYALADGVFYLPKDSAKNAKKWLDIIQPNLVFFVKYDYWYHYLHQLKSRHTPTYLVSSLFQKRQLFFKWYGQLYRSMLRCFTHIFVQNEESINLLKSISITNTTLAGDTRIDRVYTIASNKVAYPEIKKFCNSQPTIIMGSAWEEDWKLMANAYTHLHNKYKLIIAPHNIGKQYIQHIQNDFSAYSSVLFSNKSNDSSDADIMIIDTIGHLSQIYQYASIAWIGGGFKKSGIHNILEPAVHGLPIFIGPNFKKFEEGKYLVAHKGVQVCLHAQDLAQTIQRKEFLLKMGAVNATFINQNTGATNKILSYLKLA